MILKHVGLGLTVAALLCFVPGVMLSMFVLDMNMAIALSGAGFNSDIVSKDLSIITTVAELWHQDRYLVSILIFGFSILIPVLKTALVGVVYFMRDIAKQKQLIKVITSIGKWSMADVFVVAVFLAILSTNHADSKDAHDLVFFGMKISFELSTQTLSNVGQGFYFFLSYCILSLLGSQLMLKSINDYQISTRNEGSTSQG